MRLGALLQRRVISLLLVLCTLGAGCSSRKLERIHFEDPTQLPADPEQVVLKAHFADGSVLVFTDWAVAAETDRLQGNGHRLDAQRVTTSDGFFSVPLDSVALFETNTIVQASAFGAMAAITVASLAVSVYCATNPKACFGSCPTFHVETDDGWHLAAEGFSASVAPVLEASDVDALWNVRPDDTSLELKLTNEAYETHVIRRADLRVTDLAPGHRAMQRSSGGFVRVADLLAPSVARDREASVLADVIAADGREWFSLADSTDLATREEIHLSFDVPDAGRWGLVLGVRQGLLTTYLFYEALSSLGSEATSWLARLQSGDDRMISASQGMGRVLGGIDVFVPATDGSWREVDTVRETGPLAVDVDLVEIGDVDAGSLDVRLRLTRGMWRIDHIALARIVDEVEPATIAPTRVLRIVGEEAFEDPETLAALTDPERTLVTLPGDEYRLFYDLPPTTGRAEFWLESQGYYLEWMRTEWLEEDDPLLAAQMLLDPATALRRLAPVYKALEPEMEDIFWRSRYALP
jgi:hypothetical protein